MPSRASRVSRYMTREVYTVKPEDNLARARKLMLSRGIGRLIVVDDDKRPVGIITVTDIANALVLRWPNRPAHAIKVMEAMTDDPVTIEQTRTIRKAAEYMLRYGIGGLPVVNALNELVGIITRTDLLRAFAESFPGAYKVADLMRREFARVRTDHSIFHVNGMIEVDPAGKVLVFNDREELVGVIAKRDLAFVATPVRRGSTTFIRIRGRARAPRRVYTIHLAEDIMTPNPLTVEPEVDAAEAAKLMLEERIGILPVVSGDGVLGVFSKLEVLRAIFAPAPRRAGGGA